MIRVAIIGANEFQNPLILEANRRGYETHVFAWQDNAIGEKTAKFFHPVSIIEKEEILSICRKIEINAICSIGSDLAAITVNYVANALGLPGNPPETALIATNKYEMRKAFSDAGLLVPHFKKVYPPVSSEDLKELTFPIIVKPTDRSGSRGICKIDEPDLCQINEAIQNACHQSFEKAAILEEFIDGPEFSCECISWAGTHHMLSITEKFTTGAPHYIETGHLEPAALSEELSRQIQETVFHGLDALHITCGASHSEFKLVPGTSQPVLIEIGARMGGDCIGSDLVRLSTGINFVGQVLDTALGQAPSLASLPHSNAALIRFLFSSSDIDHLHQLQGTHPELIEQISEIHLPEGASIVTDSSTRYGFYILKGDSRDVLLRAADLDTIA